MRTERRRMVFLGLLAIGAGVWGGCADAVNYDELHKYCSEEWKPDLGGTLPDLSVVGPKCAAAKGLSGDAIVCVDFNTLANQTLTATPPAELPGWKFDATNCLEIAGGKLQVKNFGGFVGTCSFMMPLVDLGALGNQKYSSVTLAVVQRVDLNASASPAQQTAKLLLGVDMANREFATVTGSSPAQQNVHVLSRTVIQTMTGGTNFQPLFKLTSGAAYPIGTGWQIESVAVMGNL